LIALQKDAEGKKGAVGDKKEKIPLKNYGKYEKMILI
jgi:hypothetical protein